MEMKLKFFIITTLIPIIGITIILSIRYIYLKFNNSNHNNNHSSNNNHNYNSSSGRSSVTIVNSIYIIQIILLSISMIGIVGLFTSFSTWEYISIYSSVVLSVILLSSFTIYQLLLLYKDPIKKIVKEKYKYNSTPNSPSNVSTIVKIKLQIYSIINDVIILIQYKRKLVIRLLCLSVLIGTSIPVALDGLCICSQPISISTRFTRSLQHSYCNYNEICFIYLTLPEDPSNSMILQIHTRNEPSKVIVNLSSIKNNNNNSSNKKNSNSTGSNNNSKHSIIESNTYKSVSNIIKEESRFISYIEFNNLLESTNYKFNLTIETKDGTLIKSVNYGFKTLSSSNNNNYGSGDSDDNDLKFIVGGDLNLNNQDTIKLAIDSRKFKPDFIVIGGDIAYENGIGSCYRRWDEKLKFLSTYYSYEIDNVVYLTPLLLSIGNHEAGEFFQTHNQVPFYFNYFIFNLGDSNKQQISEIQSYHIHKLPFNTSLTSLDSCVISTWDDQVNWLNNKWSNAQYNNTVKLVVYHHPIYTSRRNINDKIPSLAQKSIVPLFDRFQVPFAFENHEHLFKRSKLLYNNKVLNSTTHHNNKQKGTIYIGDGSWGTSKYNQKSIYNSSSSSSTLPWYLEKRFEINHLWYVTVGSDRILIEAFSSDGDQIDRIEYNKLNT